MSKVKKPDYVPEKTDSSPPLTNAAELNIILQKLSDLLIDKSFRSTSHQCFQVILKVGAKYKLKKKKNPIFFARYSNGTIKTATWKAFLMSTWH